MGDRAQVVVDGVYLYSHNLGARLKNVVADALNSTEGRARWNDAPYLARIIFERMLSFAKSKEEGFGITSECYHCDHPDIIVLGDSLEIQIAQRQSDAEKIVTHTFYFSRFIEEFGTSR